MFDALDGRSALLPAAHQNDALNDIVITIHARDAKPRFRSDFPGGDMADKTRKAAVLRQHRVLEVVLAANQTDPAHHRRLRTDIDRVAADVDIAAAERLDHLGQSELGGNQLVQVNFDLILPRLAAPTGDVNHARYGPKPPLQNPILQGLQSGHAVARRTDKTIAVDFSYRILTGDICGCAPFSNGGSCERRFSTCWSACS